MDFKVPPLSLAFLENASDEFLRTALHQIGKLIYAPIGSRWARISFRVQDYQFLWLEPHKLSPETTGYHAEYYWDWEDEVFRIIEFGTDGERFRCFLPGCRSCSIGLYLRLIPRVANHLWEEAMTDLMVMLTTEKLRKLQIFP